MKLKSSFLKNQDGASAVLVAIVVAMLLGFTALAVDVGYMYSTRNELQNVADAAALAGAGELGRIYVTIDVADQQNFDVDETGMGYRTQIYDEIQRTAVQNKAAGDSISIDITDDTPDITIGTWDLNASDPSTALTLASSTNLMANAIRVIARRDSAMNNPVSTFFGFIFSFFGGSADTFEVSAVATAALTGTSTVAEGVLKAPFAISQKSTCPDEITFSPTQTSCAGWHSYLTDDEFDANANDMATRMIATIEGYKGLNPDGTENETGTEGSDWLTAHFEIDKDPDPEVPPAAAEGDTFDFQGGTISALFNGDYYSTWDGPNEPNGQSGPNLKNPAPFITLFDFFRFRDGDGDVMDGDAVDGMVTLCNDYTGIDSTTVPGSRTIVDDFGRTVDRVPADEVWTATVPVYEELSAGEDCVNPTGDIKIIGFANVHIVSPNPPPDSTVTVCLECYSAIEAGRGGGGTSGNVMGSIPNLVQ